MGFFQIEPATKLLQGSLSSHKTWYSPRENVFQEDHSDGAQAPECKRGRTVEKSPIRYVPDRDPIQEALDLKPGSLKCTLANGSETGVMIRSRNGTNEKFLLHVNKANNIAKKTGLIPTLVDAEKAHKEKKTVLKTVLGELIEKSLSKSKAKKDPRSIVL